MSFETERPVRPASFPRKTPIDLRNGEDIPNSRDVYVYKLNDDGTRGELLRIETYVPQTYRPPIVAKAAHKDGRSFPRRDR